MCFVKERGTANYQQQQLLLISCHMVFLVVHSLGFTVSTTEYIILDITDSVQQLFNPSSEVLWLQIDNYLIYCSHFILPSILLLPVSGWFLEKPPTRAETETPPTLQRSILTSQHHCNPWTIYFGNTIISLLKTRSKGANLEAKAIMVPICIPADLDLIGSIFGHDGSSFCWITPNMGSPKISVSPEVEVLLRSFKC